MFNNAVTVNADATAQVVLRNLVLNSAGGESGVRAQKVGTLYVERCAINRFQQSGILSVGLARVYVSDSTIRRCLYGVAVFSGTQLTLDSLELDQNNRGVYVENAQATIHDTVAGGGVDGFTTNVGGKMIIENSAATANSGDGFRAQAGMIMITRCQARSNLVGVDADGGTIYVSLSTITANEDGTGSFNSGGVLSRGDNTLQANTVNGNFNGMFSAQ